MRNTTPKKTASFASSPIHTNEETSYNYGDISDIEYGDIDEQSAITHDSQNITNIYSLMNPSISNAVGQFEGYKESEVINELGRRFCGVLNNKHDLTNAKEGVGEAKRYLRHVVEEFTKDRLTIPYPSVLDRESYKDMYEVESNLRNYENRINELRIKVSEVKELFEPMAHKPHTDRTVEGDKTKLAFTQKSLKDAIEEKGREEQKLVSRLRSNPPTHEQVLEYVITNHAPNYLHLYEAIQKFEWLALAASPKLSQKSDSRRIWLQKRIVHLNIGLESIISEDRDFLDVRTKLKTDIKKLIKGLSNEKDKEAIANDVVNLMSHGIRIEATDLREAADRKRQEDLKQIEDKKALEQKRQENTQELIKKVDILIQEASRITVNLARKRALKMKKDFPDHELTSFNNMLGQLFLENDIDWENEARISDEFTDLIKAFRVTKFLEAKISLNTSKTDLDGFKKKIGEKPFYFTPTVFLSDKERELLDDYHAHARKAFFILETGKMPSVERSAVNSLSLVHLESEVLAERIAQEKRDLSHQMRLAANIMETMREKRERLEALNSTKDPTKKVDVIWEQENPSRVLEFYRSKKSITDVWLYIKGVISGQEHISNQMTMLADIARISHLVTEEADRMIATEEEQRRLNKLRIEQERAIKEKQERKLAAQITRKNEELNVKMESAIVNIQSIAQKILILKKTYNKKTEEIEHYRYQHKGEEYIISKKMLADLQEDIRLFSGQRRIGDFSLWINKESKLKLSKISAEALDVKEVESGSVTDLERIDHNIDFYSQVSDFFENFDLVLVQRINEEAQRKIEEAETSYLQEQKLSQAGLDHEDKIWKEKEELALRSAEKKQQNEQLEQEAKIAGSAKKSSEIKLVQEEFQRCEQEKIYWRVRVLNGDELDDLDKEEAGWQKQLWELRCFYANIILTRAKRGEFTPVEKSLDDQKEEQYILEQISKIKATRKTPSKPIGSNLREPSFISSGRKLSENNSAVKRLFVDEEIEARGKGGSEDKAALRELELQLKNLRLEREILEKEFITITSRHQLEIVAVREDADSIVSENKALTVRLKKEKQTLEFGIAELNEKERAINIAYLKLKQTAVTNLLKILYKGLEDIAGESKKSEIIQGAKKAVPIAANSNLSNILETLGNNPNDAAIKQVVASNIRQNAENDQFLEELIDIENVVHEILAAVNRVTVEELHAKNARALEAVKDGHQSELINIGHQLKRSQLDVQRITSEKELLETQYKEEKARYESLNNQEKIILLLSDAGRWSQFPSWKHDEKKLFLEEIRKDENTSQIADAFDQVFSTEQRVTNKKLAENILKTKSVNEQKEIVAEIEGYIEKISAEVIRSEKLTLSQFKENALRVQNEIELKIILQANYAALVLNSGVTKEEVKKIVEEIKKIGKFSHNDLFNEFHQQEPDFQSIASRALKDLNSTASREKIVEALGFIDQIQININALKAEKEKEKTRGIIVDHLRRIHEIVHDKNLTDEDRNGLVDRKSLIYCNHSEKIKLMIIGLINIDPKFKENVFYYSDHLTISQITELAKNIDEEGKKIKQEALNKILAKRGEEFSKKLDEQKRLADSELKSKESDVEEQRQIALEAAEEKERVLSEVVREKLGIEKKIKDLEEKIRLSGSVNEKQTTELDQLRKNLIRLEAENLKVVEQKSQADKAESSLEDLNLQLANLQVEYGQSRKKLAAEKAVLEQEKTDIGNQLKEAIESKSAMEEEIKTLKIKIKDYESQIVADNESKKDSTIKVLTEKLRLLEEDTSKKAQEIEDLNRSLENAESARERKEKEALEEKRALEEQISTLSINLELEKQKSLEAIEQLNQRIAELKQELSKKGSSDEEKETLLSALKKQLVEEQVRLQKATESLEQEKGGREEAEAKLKQIKDTLPKLHLHLANATKENALIKSEVLQNKKEFDRFLVLMTAEKEQSGQLILVLRSEITDLKNQLGEDENAKAEKLKELQDGLDKALLDAKAKDEELHREKEKLAKAESEKTANLIEATAIQDVLKEEISELIKQLDSLRMDSESTVKSLQDEIDKLEKEKQDRGSDDNEKDLIIEKLKAELNAERQKLRELEDELERLRDLGEDTEKESHTDEAPISREGLSIEEMRRRFQEPNNNGRQEKSGWYTSAKIVQALNKVNTIKESYAEAGGLSDEEWVKIWKDDSLSNVNNSMVTLTRGDKKVLTKFALQKDNIYLSDKSGEINEVLKVSKQLIGMVAEWGDFYRILKSTKKVDLAIEAPSKSPNKGTGQQLKSEHRLVSINTI